jgi:hypothetical protein
MKSLLIGFMFLSCTILYAQSANIGDIAIKLSSNIVLHLKISEFNPSMHTIDSCQVNGGPNGWSGVCLIDHKPVYGTDWGIPFTKLDEAYLLIKGVKISLDVSCMYNPYPSGMVSIKDAFSIQEMEGGFVVKGNFSDGAGTYTAEWFVINHVSVRTSIKKGEC